MKRIISVTIILVLLLMVSVPVFAIDSPTYGGNFVSTTSKEDISAPNNPNTGFVNGNEGGITIIEVGKSYVGTNDPDGSHSVHNFENGKDFIELVDDYMQKNINSDGYYETSIVDIHTWGNMAGENPKYPNSFTLKADVVSTDTVIVHHHVGDEAKLIPSKDVVVGNGTITVNNVESLSLWSFTKVIRKNTGNGSGTTTPSGSGSDYNPPRTDVE